MPPNSMVGNCVAKLRSNEAVPETGAYAPGPGMLVECLSFESEGHIGPSWHLEAMYRGESGQESFETAWQARYNERRLWYGGNLNGSTAKC